MQHVVDPVQTLVMEITGDSHISELLGRCRLDGLPMAAPVPEATTIAMARHDIGPVRRGLLRATVLVPALFVLLALFTVAVSAWLRHAWGYDR